MNVAVTNLSFSAAERCCTDVDRGHLQAARSLGHTGLWELGKVGGEGYLGCAASPGKVLHRFNDLLSRALLQNYHFSAF